MVMIGAQGCQRGARNGLSAGIQRAFIGISALRALARAAGASLSSGRLASWLPVDGSADLEAINAEDSYFAEV